MKDVFWNRYHLCLTPGEWPSDRLVSKLFKAIDERQLEVADVKSQLHQKTTSAKRRRLGENLYLQENEESAEPEVGTDAPSYSIGCVYTSWLLPLLGRLPYLLLLRPQSLWGRTVHFTSRCLGIF